MKSEKLINDKNFNTRLKASIERKLKTSGLWKMAVCGAKNFEETFQEAETEFFKSLDEIEIVESIEANG